MSRLINIGWDGRSLLVQVWDNDTHRAKEIEISPAEMVALERIKSEFDSD